MVSSPLPALASGLLLAQLTSGRLQPLLLYTVSDLGFWVALRKVAGNDRRVPLIYFNHVLHVQLEVLEVCGEKGRCQLGLHGRDRQSTILGWADALVSLVTINSCRSLTPWGLSGGGPNSSSRCGPFIAGQFNLVDRSWRVGTCVENSIRRCL